ncbi:MAG: hypothetical protein WCP98_09120, partial [Actinomycetes bacterium]
MRIMKRTCLGLTILLLVAAAAAAAALGAARGGAVAEGAAGPPAGVAQAVATPSGEIAHYGEGYRFDSNGWIYLHIEGQPYERGFQHGRLLAPELAETMRTLNYITMNDTGQTWQYFIKAATRLWTKKIQGEYLQEIKGIAAGATSAGTPLTWQDVLALNGEMELTGYWY